MPERCNFKTTVGGQAVIEGVMMRGNDKTCLAVRAPDGEIVAETSDLPKRPWAKWPFVRGVMNFIDSMVMGYKTIMRSSEIAMGGEEEQEPSKFDLFIDRHFGSAGAKIVMTLSAVLGVVLAVLLFMLLPTAIVRFIDGFAALGAWKGILEGVIKIAVFIAYLALVRLMPDMLRVFSYHGAEHKTIACYESGAELTTENIRPCSRFHPRCGTSFIFLVLIISILVFSALPWSGTLLRVGLKLLMLPVVVGISYELLRLAGRYDNLFTRIISAPGLWLQRLSTAEPDDSMIEVAVAAVTPVLPPKPEDAEW